MKNILAYYYNVHPKEISHKNNQYIFTYNGNNYVLLIFDRPVSDIDALYKLNMEMIRRNILVHKMIVNNQNSVLTYINNIPYILLEINVNTNLRITLSDICSINNNSIDIECDKQIVRYDWVNLWETKNDYFELQINEIGKKFPNLCNYANYYIGLAENAITYVKNALKIDDKTYLCACHKRIKNNGTTFSLYNPIDLIYDFRVRDASEYIKNAFFNNEDALSLVYEFFNNNYITYKEALLFYGRLLYPSYFFDLQDDIVNNNLDEKLIETVALKSSEYEVFLKDTYLYISSLYNTYIPAVDWIIKRS